MRVCLSHGVSLFLNCKLEGSVFSCVCVRSLCLRICVPPVSTDGGEAPGSRVDWKATVIPNALSGVYGNPSRNHLTGTTLGVCSFTCQIVFETIRATPTRQARILVAYYLRYLRLRYAVGAPEQESGGKEWCAMGLEFSTNVMMKGHVGGGMLVASRVGRFC